MTYDKTNKHSIYKYALGLKGQSFNSICDNDYVFLDEDSNREQYKDEFRNHRRKGGLGELVEERYFHYKADSEARADFPEAELELKVTPYKKNKNGTLSAKERLSISMINYHDIVTTPFYDSNAWEKIKNILLVYYEWHPECEDRLDYIIDYIYLYSPSPEDLPIIINDYETIQKKVRLGLAHELSEGDTLYLGAATKSSSAKSRTTQPYSSKLAKPRVYSLKNSYMTHLLRNTIVPYHEEQDKIVPSGEVIYDLESYIVNKINQYKGRKTEELYTELVKVGKYGTSKSRYSQLAYAMLGITTAKAEEFEKANIEVKTIRLSLLKSGAHTMKESISFPKFKIKDLVEEEWESSTIRQQFIDKKYLFVIYKEVSTGVFVLDGAKFWNMPIDDIEGPLKDEWLRARNLFLEGIEFTITQQENGKLKVMNNLPKSSNTRILHVRPHASKSAHRIKSQNFEQGNLKRDADQLLNGDYMTHQSFWLNNHYIVTQLNLL